MKINTHGFAAAGAITIGIWYSALAFCFKTWPTETLKFIGSSHMIPRLENIAPYIKVTWENLVMGIAIHCFVTYLFFFMIGFLYNLFSSSRS